MPPEKATSLRRAVALLLALGSDEGLADGGMGVAGLTALLSEEKSRVSRTLQTLQEYGLVERDPDTLTYRIGWRVYALADRAGDATLLAAAPARVSALVREFGESAHLSVLEASQVLTVVSRPSPRAVSTVSWVGRHVPAHCTSSGRALLLDHNFEALERVFGSGPLAPAGPRAPRSVGELYERIGEARPAGYTIVVEESEPGLVAVAAPVRNHRGRIIAAVNLSAPAFRFEHRLTPAGERLREVAEELSLAVGWRRPGDEEDREPDGRVGAKRA
ncbi:MAG TPA: IclR family transcriptional regulator [Solirubrobacteraceae bacterium]|nr:IclR family transcriptional regulator [Solirubrobacteraceae bacterium]